MEENEAEKKKMTEKEIDEWFMALDLDKKKTIFGFYDVFFNRGENIKWIN